MVARRRKKEGSEVVAIRLGQLRRGRGWTQEDLADAAGVSQSQVSAWEGGRRTPDRDSTAKLAQAFNMEVADFERELGFLTPVTEQRGDTAEDRIWRAIWANRPLAAQLRRAMQHESEENVRFLLDRAFAITAKALEIDLDAIEREREPDAPAPIARN